MSTWSLRQFTSLPRPAWTPALGTVGLIKHKGERRRKRLDYMKRDWMPEIEEISEKWLRLPCYYAKDKTCKHFYRDIQAVIGRSKPNLIFNH